MKRIIILVILVGIAGFAGMVRSNSNRGISISQLPQAIIGDSSQSAETREEIRKDYQLIQGAQVEVSGINGAVKIETSDGDKAEVYIERTGKSREALLRRKVTIDSTPSTLTIHGEKGDVGLLACWFGSSPTEEVTLRLPRKVNLLTKGVNGSIVVGEIDGSVEVAGINGRVNVAQANGAAHLKGINGNVFLGLKEVNKEGVDISSINGNIELRVPEGLNADFEARGMNGNVYSDLSEVTVEKVRRGSYIAQVGTGGNPIFAKGINGNIRLSRAITTGATMAEVKAQ